MELLGDIGHGDLFLVYLGTVLASVQYRSRACVNHTIGDEAQVEARFGPFGDSANLDTR
jgi:hypothetical protein